MDSIFDGSDVVEKIVNPLLATTASLPPRKKGKGPLGKSAFPGPVRAVKRKETAPPGSSENRSSSKKAKARDTTPVVVVDLDTRGPSVAPLADSGVQEITANVPAQSPLGMGNVLQGGGSSSGGGAAEERPVNRPVRSARNLGFIWKEGISADSPDSVAIHLPGYSKMQSPDAKPVGTGKYAREAFRAVELPYMRNRLRVDPSRTVLEALSSLHEISSVLVHLKDDLDKRDGKLDIPEVTADALAKATSNMGFYRKQSEEHSRLRDIAEKERFLAQAERDKAKEDNCALSIELASRDMQIEKLEGDVGNLQTEVGRLNGEIGHLRDEVTSLREQLAKNTPEEGARLFMESEAFAHAAPVACLDVMRYTLYRELKKLQEYYPFTPEEIGFGNAEPAVPRKLVGYRWDMAQDILIGPDGEPASKSLKLKTLPKTGPAHVWPNNLYPRGVQEEEEEVAEEGEAEEEEEERAGDEVDAGAPPAVGVEDGSEATVDAEVAVPPAN